MRAPLREGGASRPPTSTMCCRTGRPKTLRCVVRKSSTMRCPFATPMMISKVDPFAISVNHRTKLFEEERHVIPLALANKVKRPLNMKGGGVSLAPLSRFATTDDPIQVGQPLLQVDLFPLWLDRNKPDGVLVANLQQMVYPFGRNLRRDTGSNPEIARPVDPLLAERLSELGHAVWALGQPQPLMSLSLWSGHYADDFLFQVVEWHVFRERVGHIRDKDQPRQTIQPRLVLAPRAGEVGPACRLCHATRPEGQLLKGR